MLIHFESGWPQALFRQRTKAVLDFCLSAGARLFTANYLYVRGEESETLMNEFYERLTPHSAGTKTLERIYGNGFELQECWVFNRESIDQILAETRNNLFTYDALNSPEDWLVYVDDAILLQVVTHEQEATMRLTAAQYDSFQQLGIPHERGGARWSGLPEIPIRTVPPR